ncbi:hypothetical protein L209DRAFT_751775 [Thermothelomyces heterothallicus CBS 203.75]
MRRCDEMRGCASSSHCTNPGSPSNRRVLSYHIPAPPHDPYTTYPLESTAGSI